MSLTRPIPEKLKREMEADPFYKQCCLSGIKNEKIDWHHNFIFAGTRVNEKWCILPVAERYHRKADRKDIRELLDYIMLNRADEKTLQKYSKAIDLIAKKKRLNKKYENTDIKTLLWNIKL